jgi:hypothetical protein
MSFLVAKNGQIIYEKYDGFADKENNILILLSRLSKIKDSIRSTEQSFYKIQ